MWKSIGFLVIICDQDHNFGDREFVTMAATTSIFETKTRNLKICRLCQIVLNTTNYFEIDDE